MEITNGNKSFYCASHFSIVQPVSYIDGIISVRQYFKVMQVMQ